MVSSRIGEPIGSSSFASSSGAAGLSGSPAEYLTTHQVAQRLKWAPKTLENKVRAGQFVAGVHFFRRRGMQPRWKWEAVVAWVEQRAAEQSAATGGIMIATSSKRGAS